MQFGILGPLLVRDRDIVVDVPARFSRPYTLPSHHRDQASGATRLGL
jgi:hypothetical protein